MSKDEPAQRSKRCRKIAGFIVDTDHYLNAEPDVVLAGWGWMPDRTLTPIG
ncbi:MAG: hypothetical protein ACE1Z4_10225 [Gammaproteobacteria bacterium]